MTLTADAPAGGARPAGNAPGRAAASGRRAYRTRPPEVRDAHARYERRRRYLALTGRHRPRASAGPALAHITRLQRHMSLRQIATAAGLDPRVIWDVRNGKQHVRPATAAAILAVTPADCPRTGWVPATATVRRLRALMLAGHPATTLAAELGYRPAAVRRLAAGGQYTPAATARTVAALYERLWDTPGPSERTRRNAQQRGWVPLAAWDDIADPAGQPQGIRPPRRSAAAVAEDAEELISQGMTPVQAAERLQVTPAALDQARHRRRRHLAAAPRHALTRILRRNRLTATTLGRPGRPAPAPAPAPAPGTSAEAWKLLGLCRQTDPDLFYPEPGGNGTEAKLVCVGCPVRAQCLEYAIDRNEKHGIWGGLNPDERHSLRRSRQRVALRTAASRHRREAAAANPAAGAPADSTEPIPRQQRN